MKTTDGTFYRYFPVSRRDQKWGLYVTTAGESRVAPHAAYPPGGHPEGFAFDWRRGRVLDNFALLYVSSGKGKFECRPGFSAMIEPGHAFLLFPGVWHRYAPAPKTGWHEHWLGFDGDIPRRWLRHRFISPRSPLLKINAEDTVLATFSRVMQSIRSNRPALQQILAGATANLLGLFYSAQQTLPAMESGHPDKIESAISRIQSGFARKLDMKQLADELGVGYSWFRAKFATHTGLGPHQYLLELRLVRARNLLAETPLTVKEIAMQTGFGDEHYFSRLFRQKLNCTPSQWRSRSRRGAK
jgi:AraC-like DNA-binding protein